MRKCSSGVEMCGRKKLAAQKPRRRRTFDGGSKRNMSPPRQT